MAIETIKFSQMTAGGDLTAGDQTPGLLSGGNVLFNNPWTFLAPGSTASRPVPSPAINGRQRFNTDNLVYEYYDTISATWVELSGSGTGTVNPGTANSVAFYAANGTAVSPTNSSNLAVLGTNSSGFPAFTTTLPINLTIPSAVITSSTAALTSGQVTATPVNATDIANKAYVDASFGAGVTSITGTTNQIIASSPTGAVTLSLPQDIATGSTPTFAGLTLSSIPLGASSGGTGVNNGSSTLTLGGNLTTSGAFASTFTMTGATSVTFPTSGTLATTAGTVSSVTGTANQIGSTGGTTPVISIVSNPIIPGSAGITLPSGNTAARAGSAGTIRFNSQLTLFESTVDGTNWATIETSAIGVTSITGTTSQVIASSSTGNVTLSLPQSIATSSSPTFASIKLGNNGILDSNANEILSLNPQASSVNNILISNAATTASPSLQATGSDTNIAMNLLGQGTGGVAIQGNSAGGNAASGYVGEVVTNTAFVQLLVTSTVYNTTSISLTAGDWDIFGAVTYTLSSFNINIGTISINTTSATLQSPGTIGYSTLAASSIGTLGNFTLNANYRLSISSTTTVYLCASANWSTGTAPFGNGTMIARRVR